MEHWEIEFVNEIWMLLLCIPRALIVSHKTLPLRMFIQHTRPLAHDIITYWYSKENDIMLEDKEIAATMVVLEIALIMLNSMC